MGIFNSIFGKKTQEIPDGLWLKNYRECNWVEAFAISNDNLIQTFEIGSDSCCLEKGNYFCVMRISDVSQETFGYATVSVPSGWDDEFHIIVDRAEDSMGETLKKDDWTKGRIMTDSQTSGISKSINIIKNYATMNNYSSTPPFVLFVLLAQKYI
jgi:hypothetical protein